MAGRGMRRGLLGRSAVSRFLGLTFLCPTFPCRKAVARKPETLAGKPRGSRNGRGAGAWPECLKLSRASREDLGAYGEPARGQYA
jgi:hypothetical protein